MAKLEVSDYRLAPLLAARIVGAYLVGAALLMFVATVVVAAADWPPDLLVVVLGAGVLGLVAVSWWLRARGYVVRFTDEGYRVGLVRGAGVRQAQWSEVREVVAGGSGAAAHVVLRLHDDRSTAIPVAALAADRDQFVRELQGRLRGRPGRRSG